MNCLHHLTRTSALPLQGFSGICSGKPSCAVTSLAMVKRNGLSRRSIVLAEAGSGSVPSTDNETGEKSETYSQDMTTAMGAALTYRHELGMNYNFIRPDLIVGSCLQTPADVDKLRTIGVKTIFCLQQNSDLEYFGVDITSIRDYANSFDDIEHVRAEIRDFDAFDLRLRLPAVVSRLHKAVSKNGGVAYIHCTAGLGRAPATAVAYMFWIQGYSLKEAHELLMSKRSSFPKIEAIKSATIDILSGLVKKPVKLKWQGKGPSTVEVSGLDIGWGQRAPLSYDEEQGSWILHRNLPEGRYEYKYIVDGEWMNNKNEPITNPNRDGHVNNYVEVFDDDASSISAEIRSRISGDDPVLSSNERDKIRLFLETYQFED